MNQNATTNNTTNDKRKCKICSHFAIGVKAMEARTQAENDQHFDDMRDTHICMIARRTMGIESVLRNAASGEVVKTEFGRLVGSYRASVKSQDEKNNTMVGSLAEIQKAMGEHQNTVDGMEAGFDVEMSAFRKTNSDQNRMIAKQGAQLETQGVQLDEARETIKFMRKTVETLCKRVNDIENSVTFHCVGVKRTRS